MTVQSASHAAIRRRFTTNRVIPAAARQAIKVTTTAMTVTNVPWSAASARVRGAPVTSPAASVQTGNVCPLMLSAGTRIWPACDLPSGVVHCTRPWTRLATE